MVEKKRFLSGNTIPALRIPAIRTLLHNLSKRVRQAARVELFFEERKLRIWISRSTWPAELLKNAPLQKDVRWKPQIRADWCLNTQQCPLWPERTQCALLSNVDHSVKSGTVLYAVCSTLWHWKLSGTSSVWSPGLCGIDWSPWPHILTGCSELRAEHLEPLGRIHIADLYTNSNYVTRWRIVNSAGFAVCKEGERIHWAVLYWAILLSDSTEE